MLSDHAVLQRQMPVHIWGWADVGEKVTVSFHGQTQESVADELGKWRVYLRPEQAGGPYALTVQGSNTIKLEDILVGDVWFASGQSNMEFPLKGFGGAPMKDSEREIAAATQPQIRLLRFAKRSSSYEERDQSANWTQCTPDTATDFSAVAYFFARDLVAKEHVPIGLIDSTWGGTPVRAWLSFGALSSDAGLMGQFADHTAMVEGQSDVPAIAAAEKREDAKAQAAGLPLPKHPWHPDPGSYAPAGLFNGMVAPATDYSIKGAILYQGETDSAASRKLLYEQTFSALITDWRTKWREGDFPFLFVQISSFTSPSEGWGVVRDAQRRTLKLANTGMAVSLDVGQADNVHPPDKQTVGARLALAARAVAYGETLEFSGPMFREAVAEGSDMRVYFAHAKGLMAKGGSLEGFEVAGEDGKFQAATARVDGECVVASAAGVARPVYVRYAWANVSLSANLYNAAGLPASTFTSEMRVKN